MSAPRWARALLEWTAEPDRAGEVVGDLEESHGNRVARHGRFLAALLTAIEALDMAFVLLRLRLGSRPTAPASPTDGRATRSRRILHAVSWVDVKLGVRLLLKHPGLSFVSTLGMAVAVAIGASGFGVIRGLTSSPLPLDEGDRVVTVQNVVSGSQERATHLHDWTIWRDEVSALSDLGAYRIVTRNLVTLDGRVSPSRIVEMTASGFQIARVPPLMGRHLVEDDQIEGASEVAVIGYDVWHGLFGGSPEVIGRTIRVGAATYEIVGVMPAGFAFPINNRIWVPLRLDPSDFEIGGAPELDVFGRLAPGASLDEAASQLAVVGERIAAAFPESHDGIRARVFPYTQGFHRGRIAWGLYLVQTLVSLLLVLIAVNVAALMYARTVTRTGEIALRVALGAGRSRIASQLFIEAFVLSSAAAGAGLLAARWALPRIELVVRGSQDEQIPFWWDFSLSPEALVYAFGLAVVAATIIGVVPALRATGPHLRSRLQTVGGGASGPRLGPVWTTLIVAQIAAAVAVLPVALGLGLKWHSSEGMGDALLPIDQVLVTRVVLDQEALGSDDRDRYRILSDELVSRLRDRPEIAVVAVTGTPPPWADPDVRFELDGSTGPSPAGTLLESAASGHRVGRSRVSPEYFAALDLPLLAGRVLGPGDVSPEATVSVVDETFVERVLGGGNPLGRRIRFPTGRDPSMESTSDAPWHTIVGVVRDQAFPGMANAEATAYLPMTPDPGGQGLVSLAIRSRGGDAGRLASPVHETAVEVDPMLRLEDLVSLGARERDGQASLRMLVTTVGALSLSTLLLAIAGLYALVSFTVVRRHREIGIRVALGARPHRVVWVVMRRTAWQITLGILVGLVLAGTIDRLVGGEILGGQEALLLPVVALIMGSVGIASAWAPASRGLRVEPTEALRAD